MLNSANLDCIFEIVTTDGRDGKYAYRHQDRMLKLISATKVDNLFENRTNLDSKHMFLHRCYLEPRDVLERLIRMSQDYKV